MRINVLGSSAGGGLPQWNCGCANCNGARRGEPWIAPRTQSSIAVSQDGLSWALINASPDIRVQFAASRALRPDGEGPRSTRIAAAILTDGQIDHTTGLLTLREGSPLALYATSEVYETLTTSFPIVDLLQHYCGVEWHEIPLNGASFELEGVDGVRFTALPIDSRAPPYSSRRHQARPGDNIALTMVDERTGRCAVYAPGLGALNGHLREQLMESDCILVDGTFWSADEMSRTGTGTKTAADMGHLPLAGEHGTLSMLTDLQRPAKYLIHVNNTNPILDRRSPERQQVEAAGVTVTYDGMDIEV
jgi:pyrroloquinoline quinone biosynthesis protein B